MSVAVAERDPVRANGRAPGRRPLRVCMVHFSDFNTDSRPQREARALAERGDEVDCVCLSPEATLPMGPGAVHLHPVKARKLRGGARAYVAGYGRFFAGALRKVTALDRERRFDVVEIHNMPDFLTFTAVTPKLRGVPLILNIHDTFPELFGTLFGKPSSHPLVRLVRREERASARIADALVFVTDEARELLASRGVEAKHVSVVMNTPDERLFGHRRDPVNVPSTGPARAVYHGGLGQRFGVSTLIEAFGLIKDRDPGLSLDVYGPDPDEAAEHAAVAGPNVRVAPRPTPVEEIPARLEAAQIGVVPTIRNRFTEGLLPVKLLECIHMGLPVVASRLPVVERYFSERELLFCEPGSAHSLADALLELRRDPGAARERAVRAGERLAEIEWARQREAYLGLVDGLVDEAA